MAEQEEDMQELFALKKKAKPKKASKKTETAAEATPTTTETATADAAESSGSAAAATTVTEQVESLPTYSYTDLLERVIGFVIMNNPELAGDRKRFKMKPPQLTRGMLLIQLF